MRLIILLIALIVIGLLVSNEISNETQPNAESAVGPASSDVPKIPVQPKDVKQFEKDMNAFMDNKASEQARRIDQATQ